MRKPDFSVTVGISTKKRQQRRQWPKLIEDVIPSRATTNWYGKIVTKVNKFKRNIRQ
jgi:hypothetical protein